MSYSSDPKLLRIAKQALKIEWPELKHLQLPVSNSFKLPKHVKQMPGGILHYYIVGIRLSGKYRPLAYSANSLQAALLADCVMIRIDEFLKRGLRDDINMQLRMLNFPINFAQEALNTNESLSGWWSGIISYLLTAGILVESAQHNNGGRPRNATVSDILRLEQKLDTLLFHAVTKTCFCDITAQAGSISAVPHTQTA
jgi:hypothetical protein